MNEVTTVFNTFVFPVALCILLIWFMYKKIWPKIEMTLDREVNLIEKNDDNFKITGNDGIVDYVIKFKNVNYSKYMTKAIADMDSYDLDNYKGALEPVPIFSHDKEIKGLGN